MSLRIIAVLFFCLSACRAQQTVPPQPPVKSETEKSTSEEKKISEPTVPSKKETYNLLLLLPVDLSAAFRVDSVVEDSIFITDNIDKDIISSVDFYEGVLIATDSLRKAGNNIRLKVIDLAGSEELQISTIRKIGIENYQIVFSMLRGKTLSVLSEILLQRKIPLISCASNSYSSVARNPNAICIQPSSLSQCMIMGNYAGNNYNSDNVIIVSGTSEKETERVNAFISGAKKNISEVKIKKVNFSSEGKTALDKVLSSAITNTIFIPSTDEDFVTTVFAALDANTNSYKYRVLGLPVWQFFESLEPLTMEKFNAHIFTSEYVNFDSGPVIKFRQQFRTYFSTEPGDAAYLGFDSFFILGNLFLRKQLNEAEKAENIYYGLRSAYQFSRKTAEAALENQHINVFKIEDFHLVKINTSDN